MQGTVTINTWTTSAQKQCAHLQTKNLLSARSSFLSHSQLLSLDKPQTIQCTHLIRQGLDVCPPDMVNKRKSSLLEALWQAIHDFSCFPLTLECLGVGQVGLTCQLARPHQTIAEKMTIEVFPMVEQKMTKVK